MRLGKVDAVQRAWFHVGAVLNGPRSGKIEPRVSVPFLRLPRPESTDRCCSDPDPCGLRLELAWLSTTDFARAIFVVPPQRFEYAHAYAPVHINTMGDVVGRTGKPQ